MRVAELAGQHCFVLKQAEPKAPPPGHVQVRVAAVGICGSDLHYYAEGAIGDTACVYPMVLGHEPAGTVLACGEVVTGWAPGDRAVLEPAIYCYHCEWCRTGHHNVCEHIRFMSMPEEPGYFRDVVNIPVKCLEPMPKGLGFVEATMFEPLAVILHSMEWARITPGETAVVYGAGPIGLLTIAVAKLRGASRVFAVDPVPHRRELAKTLGADAVLDVPDAAKHIVADTGKRGVDVAIDCAGKPESVNDTLLAARNAGRVVITGIPSDPKLALDFHTLRRKELQFFTTRRSNGETHEAIRLLEEMPERFVPMITHRRSLEDVGAAFDTLEHYRDGVGKIVITLA
jgi:L-iditol 2-dehydrogenase